MDEGCFMLGDNTPGGGTPFYFCFYTVLSVGFPSFFSIYWFSSTALCCIFRTLLLLRCKQMRRAVPAAAVCVIGDCSELLSCNYVRMLFSSFCFCIAYLLSSFPCCLLITGRRALVWFAGMQHIHWIRPVNELLLMFWTRTQLASGIYAT